jgi:hypothetical protein
MTTLILIIMFYNPCLYLPYLNCVNFVFWGYYAVYNGNSVLTFRDKLSVTSWIVKNSVHFCVKSPKECISHLHRGRSLESHKTGICMDVCRVLEDILQQCRDRKKKLWVKLIWRISVPMQFRDPEWMVH